MKSRFFKDLKSTDLAMSQPFVLSVGEDVDTFSSTDARLDLMPKMYIEQVLMMLKKNFSQHPLKPHKISKLFGKNVILANAKPGLGREFLIITSGLGHYSEIADRQQTKFVIVVKDNTAVAGYPEILEQKISRKDV